MDKSTRFFNAVAIVALFTGVIVSPLLVPPVWAWLLVAAFLIALLLMTGSVCTGHVFGILINERNLMSLSRFQMVLWTIIVLASYLVVVVARVKAPGTEPSFNPLNVAIPPELIALLGISATALVGTPLINTAKVKQDPGDNTMGKLATALVDTNNEPKGLEGDQAGLKSMIESTRKGILYVNPKLSDACFWDMFEGDELGNAPVMDLGKVQLFYFTVITAVAYLYYLFPMLMKTPAAMSSLPELPGGIIALLGVSSAGYLGNKAVTHTQTS